MFKLILSGLRPSWHSAPSPPQCQRRSGPPPPRPPAKHARTTLSDSAAIPCPMSRKRRPASRGTGPASARCAGRLSQAAVLTGTATDAGTAESERQAFRPTNSGHSPQKGQPGTCTAGGLLGRRFAGDDLECFPRSAERRPDAVAPHQTHFTPARITPVKPRRSPCATWKAAYNGGQRTRRPCRDALSCNVEIACGMGGCEDGRARPHAVVIPRRSRDGCRCVNLPLVDTNTRVIQCHAKTRFCRLLLLCLSRFH